MNLRRGGRRGAIVGAGAATLTAAALAFGPGTAVGAPADPVDEATQAMQEAVDGARQAAEGAAKAAEEAARAAQRAADEATRAAESAGSGEGAADSGDDRGIDTSPDQMDWLSEDLQNDLADLQDLPADQRADEVENILRDAMSGDYGDEVENWSERMVDFMDALPRDLQDDLQNVVGMQGDEAHEELQQIWGGVMDGDYGRDVRMWGTWLRQSFQQWNLGEVIQGDMGNNMQGQN